MVMYNPPATWSDKSKRRVKRGDDEMDFKTTMSKKYSTSVAHRYSKISINTGISDSDAIKVDVLLNDVTIHLTHMMQAYSDCSAVCKGLLCHRDLAAMTYAPLFLVIILVPFMGLAGAQGPCPTPCRCTLEILNCSRLTGLPGFHQVPLLNLAAPPHPFTYLDFTGNVISKIGKEVWKAYPWAEHLVLKDNSLSKLQNTSLEGLFSLTYLDVSCNKIQIIGRNSFEAVPFLQIINLSGNIIQQIANGTFRAWHGMQFLLKMDLSHNPLAVIQDSHFYGLPMLKFLDLGATDITPRILEDLLQTSLQLRILILPQQMSCCLCHIKEDIEVLCDTVKLECTESCSINATLCEKEEPLHRMQEEVMKVLEIRKKNGKNLLNILPERNIPSNDLPQRTEPNKASPALAKNDSSLRSDDNLVESVKHLMQIKADESLDVNWADKDELKKLYLLATLLQEALKERIVQLEKVSLEAEVQNELSAEASKISTDKVEQGATDAFLRKNRHVRKRRRENWPGTDQRQKDPLMKLEGDGLEAAETSTQSADKPSVIELYDKAGSQKKLAEGLDPQRALSVLRSQQAGLQSSWKRSISDSLANSLKPTGSIEMGNNENDLASHQIILGHDFGEHILTNEEILHQLLHRTNPPAEDGKSKISATDPEPSLSELSPDISLSHGTYWEHQRPSVSPPLNMALQDDAYLLGDLFEVELNKQLTSLIPNTPVRKLISHVIRILKMDCTAPTMQVACAKLISRTGLLMKLFSENINETSSLWKSYFWPSKKITNMTTANSRKLEKPLGRTTGQGIPAYEKKLLWAVSVTAIIMIIIAAICLIEICSQHSSATDRSFLGRRKKSLSDLEDSRRDSQMADKPLWLKDMYETQGETQRDSMVVKLHDQESLEKVDIVSRSSARSSLTETPMKKFSSKALSVPMEEAPPPVTSAAPLPPPPPTSQKGSVKAKGSSVAPSSKAASSAGEGDDEDEGDSAEKSEAATTEPTTESAHSEEEEDEEESD
uniref:Uncharacterized protein n=1 Tax=Sphaerodactylus townsendi TaxID=933632 RepID=A0ACB8E8V4_9SAUR